MMTKCEIRNRHQERLDHTFHSGVRADVLVILGHGVTGNKDRPLLIALAEGLAARGWPGLRISYSGNGGSEGLFENCTISKEVADLQAVLDVVPKPVKVAYVGHSMGAAVGVLTAARDMRICGLVSLAGMTHTHAFVEREFGHVTAGAGLMWDDAACPLSVEFTEDLAMIHDTLAAAEAVTQPWLLIHGGADDVVPIQDGHDAYQAAMGEKSWLEIPAAGHSFDDSSYLTIIESVDAWLISHFGPSAGV